MQASSGFMLILNWRWSFVFYINVWELVFCLQIAKMWSMCHMMLRQIYFKYQLIWPSGVMLSITEYGYSNGLSHFVQYIMFWQICFDQAWRMKKQTCFALAFRTERLLIQVPWTASPLIINELWWSRLWWKPCNYPGIVLVLWNFF